MKNRFQNYANVLQIILWFKFIFFDYIPFQTVQQFAANDTYPSTQNLINTEWNEITTQNAFRICKFTHKTDKCALLRKSFQTVMQDSDIKLQSGRNAINNQPIRMRHFRSKDIIFVKGSTTIVEHRGFIMPHSGSRPCRESICYIKKISETN